MGEPNDRWFASRRSRTLAIVAVTTAVVIVVSVVGVAVSNQIKDYHDAKYRAQYVIIRTFSPVIGDASREVLQITNENTTMGEKLEAIDLAWTDFRFLLWSAEELRVMYLNDDEKSGPLMDLREAFAALGDAVSESKVQLRGSSYAYDGKLTASFSSALNSSIPKLDALMNIVEGSVDGGVNATAHPYSLIDRMDLAALQQTSRGIAESLSEWRPATTMVANLL